MSVPVSAPAAAKEKGASAVQQDISRQGGLMLAQKLTLDRLYASPDLSGAQPRALKISPDGKLVTLLRNRADDRDRFDLWAIDTSTGKERMLVDSMKFGTGAELSEAEKMQRERARIGGTRGIVAYDWAADARHILVPLDGDLFLAAIDGKVTRLTNTAEGELNPAVSPQGKYASFVRGGNLVVTDIATKAETTLTTGASDTISWGLAEFVAQEEMDRTAGYWWSPDDALIAVARVDESGVAIVNRAAIGAEGTKIYPQRYPLAGTANAVVDLYIINPVTKAQVKVDLGTDKDVYLARVNWARDGKTLYVQRQSRNQQKLDLFSVDPATGVSRIILTETGTTWINLHKAFRPLSDGSFLWWSERNGNGHLYRVQAIPAKVGTGFAPGIAPTGVDTAMPAKVGAGLAPGIAPTEKQDGKWTAITDGEWQVRDVIGIDEKAGTVTFTGNRETPLEQHIYTASLSGNGDVKRLSEAGYWNNAVMDNTGSRLIISRSSTDQPTQIYLADKAGEHLRWLSENRVEGAHPYAPYRAAHVKTQFGTIRAKDGSTLYTKMLTPALEKGKRYPVFMIHYGGPGAGRQVTNQWGGALSQYLVQQGWVVFAVDNRGTPDRGKAFEDHIYRAMGTIEVEDQLSGVEWLKAQDFVDPARIATYGWSYGGYLTLKLLEKAPGVFAAGVSGAPVSKWGLYDTHYTERYLGDPNDKVSAYPAADAIEEAGNITDPLLLIHGMADDNVVLEHSTAFMAEMQEKGRPFELMLYPGQTHRFAGEGVNIHNWRTIEQFLRRLGLSPDAEKAGE